MKKTLTLLSLIIAITACNQDENPPTTDDTIIIIVDDFPDPDGDGVETVQEQRDGTDPNIPCSYKQESQIFSRTSLEWRNNDCDGDGVTNGKELDPDDDGNKGPDPTNERMRCDYNPIFQDYARTIQEWRNFDCDGDSVTNGNEVDPDGNNENNNNGTNPLDWCSLIVSQQTLPLSNDWLKLDCDEDCKNNSQELAENTNPADANDFSGQGSVLKEIVQYNFNWYDTYNGEIQKRCIFDAQGRYSQTENENGNTIFTLTYDANNRLISAGNTTFEYTNNQISKVQIGSNVRDVVFNGNTIITYDGTEPPGLFKEKFILDTGSGKVIQKENYTYDQGTKWDYYIETYNYYNANFENLQSRVRDADQVYDSSVGMVISNDWEFDPTWYYSYEDEVINPYISSISSLYYNFLLQDTLLDKFWAIKDFSYSHFSSKFPSHASFFLSGGGINYTNSYRFGCYSNTLMPFVVYDYGQYGNNQWVVNFIYD